MSLCVATRRDRVPVQVTRLRTDLLKSDANDFRKSIKSNHNDLFLISRDQPTEPRAHELTYQSGQNVLDGHYIQVGLPVIQFIQ